MQKMYDVGHKMSEDMAMPTKENKNKKHYPSLHLSDEEFPALKGKDVGDKLSVMMDCVIAGYDMNQSQGQKKKVDYRLEIHRMGEEGEIKMYRALEKATEGKEG